MKTIILGLGNLLFTDDGAGILIARDLKKRIDQKDITIIEDTIGGLDILDKIAGYEKAIIIDAIQTPRGCPGSVYRLESGPNLHFFQNFSPRY